MTRLKWIKRPHPTWGKNGREKEALNMISGIYFPRWQWIDKSVGWSYSIIYPRPQSMQSRKQYELYDGEDCYIFNTLAGAKAKAYKLKTKKND